MRSAGILLLAFCLGACGYQIGFGRAAPGIRSVAVRVVDNHSFRQRFERDLTRQLVKQIREYSGYRPASLADADAILEVRIVAIRNSTQVYGVTRPVREGSLDAVAQISLRDRHSGEKVVDDRRRDIAEYRVLIGETEASARAELVRDLARSIVLALEESI